MVLRVDALCRNSGRVWFHRIEGEAVASDENVIDVVGGLPAVAGRQAGTERRGEDRAQLLLALAPRPPPHQADGLPRHIRERGFEGLQPAAKRLGIDQAVINRWCGRSRGPERARQGDDARVIGEDGHAGARARVAAGVSQALARVIELEGRAPHDWSGPAQQAPCLFCPKA